MLNKVLAGVLILLILILVSWWSAKSFRNRLGGWETAIQLVRQKELGEQMRLNSQ